MARIWSSGFEQNTNTSNSEWTTTAGSPAAPVTTTVRSGTYAGQISSLTSATRKGWRYDFANTNKNGPYYARFYLRIATLPSANNSIFGFSQQSFTTATLIGVQIDSTGALQLYDEDGTIGSVSSALSLKTWYRVEVKIDLTAAGGSHIITALLDGTQFASASNRNISTGVRAIKFGGNLDAEAQTVGSWFFDDIALNDNTGSFQTSYPGSGKIIHLSPNAAGDANTFATQVGGTAGSTNNFGRVSEITPDDVTSYNASTTLNQEDLFNVANSGIGAADNVNVVAVGVRTANITAADTTTAIKLEIEKTASGTISQSAAIVPNTTTFNTNATSVPRPYPLITYQDPDSATWTQTTLDSMQIGYKLTAAGTNTVAISTLWAQVDYTPAGVSPSASLSPSSSISPSISPSSSLSPSSSVSPSISPSASLSPSSSISPSISPSASVSPSSSVSASISPSSSLSPSSSTSASISPSASRSPSSSVSASISPSASLSPSSSVSSSISPSASVSPSASASPSAAPGDFFLLF